MDMGDGNNREHSGQLLATRGDGARHRSTVSHYLYKRSAASNSSRQLHYLYNAAARPKRGAMPGCAGMISSVQFDIPVEIIPPRIVQVIGREAAAMLLQLPAGRADRGAVQVHMRFPGRA